jgi:hypothetical protein
MLRKAEVGLSVNRKARVASNESISQNGRFVCFLAIKMRRLTELGLSAKIKEHDPAGAEIVGLPPGDSDLAEEWAFTLIDAFEWDQAPNQEQVDRIKSKFYVNNPGLSSP